MANKILYTEQCTIHKVGLKEIKTVVVPNPATIIFWNYMSLRNLGAIQPNSPIGIFEINLILELLTIGKFQNYRTSSFLVCISLFQAFKVLKTWNSNSSIIEGIEGFTIMFPKLFKSLKVFGNPVYTKCKIIFLKRNLIF